MQSSSENVPPRGFELLDELGPCLIVAKPGGLLTQAPPSIDSLERRIKAFLKVRDNKPGRVYLGVPHRLDRPVSGVMVFAKHVRAARRIAEQFQARTVQKKYWVVVEGHLDSDKGTWTDSMRKIPDVALAEIVGPDDPGARQAVLHYRLLARLQDSSLLEVELETGRMHQIRLQAASRGHPILGDAQYGARTTFGPKTDDPRQRWIALHARSLRFRHPMTRETVERVADLPAPWTALGLPT